MLGLLVSHLALTTICYASFSSHRPSTGSAPSSYRPYSSFLPFSVCQPPALCGRFLTRVRLVSPPFRSCALPASRFFSHLALPSMPSPSLSPWAGVNLLQSSHSAVHYTHRSANAHTGALSHAHKGYVSFPDPPPFTRIWCLTHTSPPASCPDPHPIAPTRATTLSGGNGCRPPSAPREESRTSS